MTRAKQVPRALHLAARRGAGGFLFQEMQEDPYALDRLDIRFRWGRYGIQLLRCHLTSFSPAYVVPAHQHQDYEFHFIPRGKGTVRLKDGAHPLHAGLFYLTGPRVVHEQIADEQESMYELCLHIDIVVLDIEPGERNAFLSADSAMWGERWEVMEADACVRQLKTMAASPLVDQYNAMNWFLTAYRACRDHEPGAYTTIQQAVIQILLRAAHAQNYTQSTSQSHAPLPSRDMNAYRYQLATQYIRDNHARSLTLAEVADELHICERQLQRIMEKYAGETFSSYLEHYRITQVCLALTQVDLTVEQIAVSHGFSSGSYLHHVFKKRLGVTPSQYREHQHQDYAAITVIQQATSKGEYYDN